MLQLTDGERLTPEEAARERGVSEDTVYRHYRDGKLSGEMILGRLMFTRAALEEWAVSRGKGRARDAKTGKFIQGGDGNNGRTENDKMRD